MKNSSDTIGNRTRDLPTCSAVPQPTALRRAPHLFITRIKDSMTVTTPQSYCVHHTLPVLPDLTPFLWVSHIM